MLFIAFMHPAQISFLHHALLPYDLWLCGAMARSGFGSALSVGDFVEYFDLTGALLVFPPQRIGQLAFDDPAQSYLVGLIKVVYVNL